MSNKLLGFDPAVLRDYLSEEVCLDVVKGVDKMSSDELLASGVRHILAVTNFVNGFMPVLQFDVLCVNGSLSRWAKIASDGRMVRNGVTDPLFRVNSKLALSLTQKMGAHVADISRTVEEAVLGLPLLEKNEFLYAKRVSLDLGEQGYLYSVNYSELLGSWTLACLHKKGEPDTYFTVMNSVTYKGEVSINLVPSTLEYAMIDTVFMEEAA